MSVSRDPIVPNRDRWARRRVNPARRSWRHGALAIAICASIGIGIFGLIVGWVFFCTWVLMTAWNYVMPAAFGWPALTFWQAFALSVVLNILTSGVGASVRSER